MQVFKKGDKVLPRPSTVKWHVKHEEIYGGEYKYVDAIAYWRGAKAGVLGTGKVVGYSTTTEHTYRVRFKSSIGYDESYFEAKELSHE